MIRKQIFSMIAAAAFLLSIGGPVAAKAVQPTTKWFHVNSNSGPMENPNCIDGEPLCAIQYFVDEDGRPLAETGLRAYGDPK